ncbi:MAG: M6 family metalloprotease domain-containing protein [Candidatus Marinimicrobia bacterium]|jgi:M6 family metalloprotease-like protein|nr:M6 family metalloprotease domain-containing protein [Candidatus Neomarinimicrobiota bacterium]MBT3575982.1 M6 family metalloprotease domain-containing protein [Candidatus Neomarinimicrobiota bacterium]MBT3679766.1 M6 family metalloprotease domain-containing protein [Candidatus Neomarinimicrobiota bacterium]MBT3950445.1 M6 family metalloprotease domain-containing protein [Candidatus Neomarinimicrobiota bacterium]MBT4253325.1 M6 family metalloprotease domain-containing protein [Candidatus Neom
MYKNLILVGIVGISTVMAISPPKPGVIPPAGVIQQAAIMAETHGEGGLADRMQRIRLANIQHAENGTRDLREDVYMSFPVILGSYSDSDDDPNAGDMLQQELFDGPWPSVTMTEHYEEMSMGQFHVSGGVYGWYELSETGHHYGGTDNGWDGGVGDFLQESLDASDIEIDFTQYDNDGDDGFPNSGDDDGFVDAVFFVHSGIGAENGGVDNRIWSHSWSYSGASGTGSAYTTNDTGANGNPIYVDNYIIQPAENGTGDLIEIGVFSHEFGHALGLPDLYDTDGSSDGIGDWCLMSGGSWTSPSSPAHMSAWCKEMMGWVIPVVQDVNMDDILFTPVVETGFVLKLWTNGEMDSLGHGGYSQDPDIAREYFLIENRQILGTDQHLVGTGLMVYHIDNSQWGNSNEEHRLVDVEPASGFGGGTTPGHPWPGASGNRIFDFETFPSSMNYAGQNTQVSLFNISDSDSIMSASVEVTEAYRHLYINDMSYTDENTDGFLSPEESGTILLELVNYGVLTTGIYASVIEDNPAFTFTASEVTFDDLEVNTSVTANAPFEFTMAADFERGTAVLQVAVGNATFATIDTLEFEIVIGDPQVALIDADGAISGSADVQEYYLRAIQDNDIVYALWDIARDGLPQEEWLLAKPQVVWYTGNTELPLTPAVIELLTAYQDAGGRLLLSGQDMADGDEAQAAFLSEYCGAVYSESLDNLIYVFGDPQHEIMSGADQYIANSYFGAENQTSPDLVTSLSHSHSLFQYPLSGYQTAGTTTIQNGYKTIFMAFGFEALAPLEGDAFEARADLMSRFLEWFELDYVGIDQETVLQPLKVGISEFYPNPFNPSVTIKYAIPAGVDISLTVYDISGREIANLASGEQPAGSYEVNWNGINDSGKSVSTGVYFARLEAGDFSQTIKMVYLR